MFRSVLVVLVVLSATSSLTAQDAYVLELYGDGVHAFHRGEIAHARAQFDKAIHQGSRDPRVFYYRALTNLQYGDQAMADQDIRTGVSFELQGLGTYDIGRALERVQGPHRLQFEQQRRDIQLAMSSRPLQAPPVEPYLQPSVIDERPLADEVPGPALDPFRDDDELTSDATDLDLDATMPAEEAPAVAPEVAPEDPFGEEMAEPAAQPIEQPAAEPAADADPFGMDAAEDDPFAADAAEDDPFAEPADAAAEEDPLGAEPSAEEAPAEEDPFGAEEAPADSADDPFGEAPADEAADEDPFG
jgi:hypothetical protein